MSAASTGGTEGSSPASSPASATSLTMAAPKYGTLVPNRIFVGGISANTSVDELTELFSSYGTVKATKIIADRAGVSKGYGFVTFETEEEAKRLQQESECIVLKERKLNIAPAIKKQSFNRSFDGGSGSPPSVPTSTFYYTNGMGLAYQNGMTFYNTAAPAPTTPIAPATDPTTLYQATGVFGPQAAGHQTFAPVMYPCPGPSLYMPQQYQYPPVPYEPYYAGTAAAGAPPYLYPASNSQNNSSGGGSSPGSGNNGTSATGSATGPPPQPLPSLPPPPPPAHFYAPAAPPQHHHPPVAAAAPPPQVDHMYYPYTAGPHPLPPHAPMGLTDQQLPLYTTDTSCQQTSSSDGQTGPQEDTRSTSSHSEQPHGETQAASGSATPLVSLMPVKFPMSGRYTNYHPIAIHTANLYSSQTCLNENDECSANQMHCRAFVYHPAVYIPHSHTPPFHNASGGTSLLPTPPAISQQMFESSSKSQSLNSKDYMKSGATNAHSNYIKSQNHGGLLPHQSPFSKAQNLGNSQSYKHSSLDGNYKYASPPMSSRLPSQYGKRTAGSGVGSSACFPMQKTGSYGPAQNLPKLSNYGGHMYSPTCTTPHKSFGGNSSQSFEYANGRRNAGINSAHYFDNSMGARSNRKNSSGSCRNNNSASAGHLDGNISSEGYGPNNPTDSANNSAPGVEGSESGNCDKPSSPPPAPYSPMTRPLPTMSPPAPQVQFYAPAQNRYQPSLAPSQHQHQQQQQQQSNQRRYTVGPTLATNRKSMDKYGSGNNNTGGTGSTGSQATMLRQSKYKVNGIMQSGGKVPDDGLGGAGDAPPGIGRMPITPPGTPRTHSTHSTHSAADQNQLNDTCHQMQALSL